MGWRGSVPCGTGSKKFPYSPAVENAECRQGRQCKHVGSTVAQTQVPNLERNGAHTKNRIVMQLKTTGHMWHRGCSEENLLYDLEEPKFTRQTRR